MAIEATLEFFYADASVAETVERAVRLDAGDIQGDRSEATVERDGARVIVTIEADDPTALRAAKRTWCSQIAVAEETIVAAS